MHTSVRTWRGIGIPNDLGMLALLLAAGAAIGVLIPWESAPVVLLAAAGFAFLGLLLRWPELATPVVLFAVYANLPVVASKFHGVPKPIAAALCLLLLFPLIYFLALRGQGLIFDKPFRLMGLLFMVLTVCSLGARSASDAFASLANYAFEGLLLYFLIVNVIRSEASLRRAVWSLLLAGILMGSAVLYSDLTRTYTSNLGGLAQRDTEFGVEQTDSNAIRILRERSKVRTSHRAQGPVGESNRFAQVMLMLAPLAFFQLRHNPSRSLRWMAGAALLMSLSGVFLSYSRGAFLILVVMALMMVGMRLVSWRQAAGAAAVGLLMVIIVAPGYLLRVGSIRGVESLYNANAEVEADGATRGRMTEMLSAVNVFLDHPVLGVGPGQYKDHYSIDYQLNPDIAFREIRQTRRAHSLYLEMAAETGVVGLAAFGLLMAYVLRRLRRLGRILPSESAALATGLWFGLVAYLGTGIFLHLAYQRYLWLYLALCAAAIRVLGKEEECPA